MMVIRMAALSFLFLLALLCIGGCAGLNPTLPNVAHAVVDGVGCAAGEYETVRRAINGPSSITGIVGWLDVVAELFHCVPDVIHDLERSDKVAGPGVALSQEAKRRIRYVKWMLKK